MIRKIFLMFLSIPTLCGCNSNGSQNNSISWEDIEAEDSVLQTRIDSGYFDKEYHHKLNNIALDKSRITISIKHEISVCDKILTPINFPELDLLSFEWFYDSNNLSQDNYRTTINIFLSNKENDSQYIYQIKSLKDNYLVYDVEFTLLSTHMYI